MSQPPIKSTAAEEIDLTWQLRLCAPRDNEGGDDPTLHPWNHIRPPRWAAGAAAGEEEATRC
jgi:hypothetical protein